MGAVPNEPCAASPFHSGEQAIQEKLGVRDKIEAIGRRIIRDFMVDQHRDFYASLPFLIVGAVDDEGQPWASILPGAPGFITSPDPKALRIATRPLPMDPLAGALKVGAQIGGIGIEFATRRRNRVNGVVSAISPDGFDIAVTQSFGNCPKYIQARDWAAAPLDAVSPGAPRDDRSLGLEERAMIAQADTFFIASALTAAKREISHGVDASHRGGKPGFTRVDGEHTLTVPDFAGNFAFNTLGNLLLEPRCGLLFVDFETGTTLQIAARAEIIWDGPEVAAFAGAQRLVRFHVSRTLRVDHAVPLRWAFREYSPFLQELGSWHEPVPPTP